MDINARIVEMMAENEIGFVTTVPCKQLGGVIDAVDRDPRILHVPCNKEDEGMGLCAGAYMGGRRPCIIMQNTALGVTYNTLATLIQFYQIPLPMLISYRGEIGERVACQVEMALHTKAILNELKIPTYHLSDALEAPQIDGMLKHAQMSKKPVAILTDARFWSSAA
ncbi:MAG: sulfopyruvate decarboxylase subunit alpha [Geminicoccaceae bacterium]